MKNIKKLKILCSMLTLLFCGLPAMAETPTVGWGVGLGEIATAGITMRYRQGDVLGVEPGIGLQYYTIEAKNTQGEVETVSSTKFALGGQSVFYFTRAFDTHQHGVLLGAEYSQATGTNFLLGYRYEYYFGRYSTLGIHMGVGVNYAPFYERTRKSLAKEVVGTEEVVNEQDQFPLFFNLGMHF